MDIMSKTSELVILMNFVQISCCLHIPSAVWSVKDENDVRLTHMVYLPEEDQLFIGATNSIYQLHGETLTYLNHKITRNTNNEDELDNNVTMLVLNKTEEQTFITWCGDAISHCVKSDPSNISAIFEHFTPSLHIHGAVALPVSKKDSSRDVDYTFYGCPHSETQSEEMSDISSSSYICSKPGLRWRGYERRNLVDTKIKFKPLSETDIETEKYIKAMEIDDFRIFFSLQRSKKSGLRRSKIAQVCQHYGRNKTPTEFTYVDMDFVCGNYGFDVLTDVEKIRTESDYYFIATFTSGDRSRSGICVYSYIEIKAMFVENIKDCYRGNSTSGGDDDYMDGVPGRCGVGSVPDISDDAFLCNEEGFEQKFSVIGRRSLIKDPVLTYNHHLTGVAVSVVRSEWVAFLGTNLGQMWKAVVHPQGNARRLDSVVMVANMEAINPDIYIDRNGERVYAMTSFKVAKIPVETCSDYSTCKDCLTSRDPYCGWCVVKYRCTTASVCNTTWLGANNENAFCPQLTVSPNVTSVSAGRIDVLVNLSPELPELETVNCLFHSENQAASGTTGLLGNSSATDNTGNWTIFKCRTPDFMTLKDIIHGSANISISIQTRDSSQPIVRGKLTVYDCSSFQSCLSCQSGLWSCFWCGYDNKCVQELSSCTQDAGRGEYNGSCPFIEAAEEMSLFMDNDKTLYLPVHQTIDVILKGEHLLEPDLEMRYSCRIQVASTQPFEADWLNSTHINCHIDKDYFQLQSANGRQRSLLEVWWGNSSMGGQDLTVEVYSCTDLAPLVSGQVNCDKCKSFQIHQPYLQCKWCGHQCVYLHESCQSTIETAICPRPFVTKVIPRKFHMNTPNVRIDIFGVNLGTAYRETIDSVTIGNQTCVSLQQFFKPSERLSCSLEAPGEQKQADLTISLPNRTSFTFAQKIEFKKATISSINPSIGPLSGGTLVTLYGNDLDIGRDHTTKVGHKPCEVITKSVSPDLIVCNTTASESPVSLTLSLSVDNFTTNAENISFEYVDDPLIKTISTRISFYGGGRRLTVTGTNFHAIQKPKIYIRNILTGQISYSQECQHDDRNSADTVIYCPSPEIPLTSNSAHRKMQKRETNTNIEPWLIGFEMDGVQSVRNLPDNLAKIVYVANPDVFPFDKTQKYTRILFIKGERMARAASMEDVRVNIGQEKCNITEFEDKLILCKPPEQIPELHKTVTQFAPIEVQIGFIKYSDIGKLDYGTRIESVPQDSEERSKEYIIAGTFLVTLLLVVLVLVAVVIRIRKKKNMTERENEMLMYKMDNLEASVSKQCKEEFAALQTTMSDLTSDLEGGNVLFRDYSVYASKILFTEQSHPALYPPTNMSDSMTTGMEAFKGLLKNKDFLLQFIKILEKQQSFTIQDRSNLASLLMAIYSDNMEFVTEIMKTLLNDLIDKTVAEKRTKLLLRRSEGVVEKLVTHWMSICLYHYLKEQTGSALFILYKAIKVQAEKGPLDYITGCAKYTLSEEKLFKALDAEINARPVSLNVHHHDYISEKDHDISVQVLDCDTITQAKNKLLDVLYKNVPYSQRPNVHRTLFVMKETDGTERSLHDEDASNEKDGIWKRLNTLQHYNVKDGAKVELTLSTEHNITMLSDTNSPDSFVVGSVRRSKQVMRTISGSNFWHLTKQHRSDEVQLSSEIFLPRLLNTKGTLQKYIDDLFAEMLKAGEEHLLIIRYFFDFLDGAAARHDITDPDVLHTWKCNSLLLRFWVNLVKNPEFVFDIHKPNIVDACLSVITQTLMDSCSTSALTLGRDSPSNKLLFAKDIPRYKEMVQRFFQEIKDKPPISDQDLNCFLTEKVSQKYGDCIYASSALLEVFKYASKYKDEIMSELRALEIPADATSAQNQETPFLMKLQQIYNTMAACQQGAKLEEPGSSKPRKSH